MNQRLSRGIAVFSVLAALAAPPLSARFDSASASVERKAGFRLGFSLSGGLLGIDGGDFNRFIRDSRRWAADANAAAGRTLYALDWREMKTMPDFRGEVFARFGRYFGVGLGVEYIRRTHPGAITFAEDDSFTTNYLSYYFVTTKTEEATWRYSQSLTVVPITLQLTGYLPLGRRGEAFLSAGPGLYLGKWKSTLDVSETSVNNLDWFWNDGTAWPPSFRSSEEYAGTHVQEATCRTVGFQIGAGFAFALSDRLSLFGEAAYRMANFKKWSGTGHRDDTERAEYGWTNQAEPTVIEDSESESWSGDAWAYEEDWPDLAGRYYLAYGVFESQPGTGYGTNVRRAEIDLKGLSLRFGIRIAFVLGRGR